jgi:hypothetical protein
MSILQRQTGLVLSRLVQIDAEKLQQILEFHPVNHALAEQFENARHTIPIFKLSQPGVGDVILFVGGFFRNLAYEFLHFAGGDAEAIPNLFEVFAGTGK